MSAAKSVEDRLTALESELAVLKQRLPNGRREKSWVESITGSFRNQPEFDEVLRLGRELRHAEGESPV